MSNSERPASLPITLKMSWHAGEPLDAHLAVDEDRGDVSGGDQVLQVVVDLAGLVDLALELVVDGGELFVDRLQLFLAGFQLLGGRAQFLVDRLQLLVGARSSSVEVSECSMVICRRSLVCCSSASSWVRTLSRCPDPPACCCPCRLPLRRTAPACSRCLPRCRGTGAPPCSHSSGPSRSRRTRRASTLLPVWAARYSAVRSSRRNWGCTGGQVQ